MVQVIQFNNVCFNYTNLTTFQLLYEDPFVLKMQAIAQQQNPAYNCVFRIEQLRMLD